MTRPRELTIDDVCRVLGDASAYLYMFPAQGDYAVFVRVGGHRGESHQVSSRRRDPQAALRSAIRNFMDGALKPVTAMQELVIALKANGAERCGSCGGLGYQNTHDHAPWSEENECWRCATCRGTGLSRDRLENTEKIMVHLLALDAEVQVLRTRLHERTTARSPSMARSRHSFGSDTCDRCGVTPIGIHSMSRFNTDWLCVPCLALEKEHPEYARAAAVELEAVQSGDLNYPGIGCPLDLIEASRAARTARESSR